MAQRNARRKDCACMTGGKCDTPFCPQIAVVATAEARLPVGSPGWLAAERLASRRGAR